MKHVLLILCLVLTCTGFAQTQEWGSYYSYNNVVDVAQSDTRVYAASESAMFYQSIASGELNTITSVDGLKAEGITALYYSATYGRTLVGNSNGLLLVVNTADNSVVTKIDIVAETTIPQAKKKINHIFENNGLAYISCDFGIVVFNLATLQFGDTYYLGPAGAEIPVVQATVHEGYIYTVTGGYGIRRALLANPNLNDYSQWEHYYGGFWSGIASFDGTLLVTDNNGACYKLDNGNITLFNQFPSAVTDFRVVNDALVVTCTSRVYVYNDQLQQAYQINTLGEPLTFTCATIVGGKLYVGTTEKGLFSVDISGSLNILNVTPNGPLRSSIFSLEKTKNYLWAVYGGFTYNYRPEYQAYGVSKYSSNDGWKSIAYNELSVFGNVLSISDISVNPNNEKEVYLNSFASGLLKLVDDVPVMLYTDSNSELDHEQKDNSESTRINGGTFDKEGNLWVINTRVKKPLKKLKAGTTNTWESYSFEDFISSPKDVEYGKMVIDNNNTKWIPSIAGLIGYNETLGPKYIVLTTNTGLPTDNVRCVALDHNNRLWIGTISGIRVLSAGSFTTEDALEATSVIILEDGVAQELMYEQVITDIEVDGANNKWFGTGGSGAFLVSPDGQNTIFHFTKDNSPLPSNTINDIDIDDATGEVFFATDRGMVSYKGTSTAGKDDLSQVYVYPNPVRPGFDGDVKITNLTDKANVKITDIEGNLVYETTSEGGTILWDTRAFGKYKVASGVYMIFISTEDTTLTKVKKVMVVR